jgi:endonuclease/exonuclease/phosphatase (EEP) superfamily protein YafD
MKRFFLLLASFYLLFLALWAAFYWLSGDQLAGVAALTAFAPYLFLPAVFLPAVAIMTRKGWLWLALLGVVVLWLALFGRLFTRQAVAPTTSASFRVLSFNVHGGNSNTEAVLSIIRQARPDVIALQELNPTLASTLQSTLQTDYPYHQLAPAQGTAGMGTFSRYPLSPLPFQTESRWVGIPLAAEIRAPQGAFALLNAHFMVTHPHTRNPLTFLQVVDTTYQERLVNVQEILAWKDQQTLPLFLACDCNLTDLSTAHQALVAGQLQDSWLTVGFGFGATFRFPQIPAPLLRVDYLWHDAHIAARAIQTLGWDGESDHHAIVGEFILQNPD